MRAYVMTTALVFALLVVVHVWRMVVETHLTSHPMVVVSTVVAAAFAVWGVLLLRRPAAS